MRCTLLLLVFVFFVSTSNQTFGQLQDFNLKRHQIDKRLMLGLGGWATANIAGSGMAWILGSDGKTKYFHQMNVMWNLVNLGLSIPGYIKANKGSSAPTLYETLNQQRKTETIFLINAGIDLAYISSGILLRNKSTQNTDKDRLLGFGNSMILQGGFLLIFDWIAYTIHRRHSKDRLSPLLQRIELSDHGIGLKLNLGTNTKNHQSRP